MGRDNACLVSYCDPACEVKFMLVRAYCYDIAPVYEVGAGREPCAVPTRVLLLVGAWREPGPVCALF